MLKSKPLIIVLMILGGFAGLWVGINVFSSGFAQILMLVLVLVIGFMMYKSLSGNRRLEKMSDADRSRALAEAPVAARALVYREGFMAKLAGFDIAIDGVSYAQLKSPQSVAIDLPAGEHQLVVKVAGKNQPPFAFSAGTGEIAVIRIGMGIAGAEISREDAAYARTKLTTIPMVKPDGVAPAGATLATAG
jgi:hypothetical protein